MKNQIRCAILAVASKSKCLRKRNNIRLQKRYSQYCIREDAIKKAENLTDKTFFIEKYGSKWPERMRRWEKQIDSIKVKGGESFTFNKDDVLFSCLAYGLEPDEYFSYHFAERSPYERRTFISDRDTMCTIFQI